MPSGEHLSPVAMRRVAVVAPTTRWRAVLAEVADAGVVDLDGVDTAPGADGGRLAERLAAAEHADPAGRPLTPRLGRDDADVDRLVADGRLDRLAGEVELERVTAAAVQRNGVTAALGWAPRDLVAPLDARVRGVGGDVVELDTPRGVDPPTVLRPTRAAAFRPLVDLYATVPYRDVDPTWFAAAAYVVMFGMMFGDAGDGLLLMGAALALRFSRSPRVARLRTVWPLILALGASASLFGLLYGEFFGPTGVLPVLWLEPLEEPVTLLAAGVAVGAVLLAVSYALGIVNRWREGGFGLALYAPTGIAGATLFLALALVVAAAWWGDAVLWVLAGAVGAAGLVLAFVGLRAQAGPGPGGAAQAAVELFDTVIRLLSNVVSFARLAAFGLTHAALGAVVWDATTALWVGAWALLAVLVFVVGRAITFALEALVAGVQALRLSYYELFSRVFVTEGRPYRPWHVPLDDSEEVPCSPG